MGATLRRLPALAGLAAMAAIGAEAAGHRAFARLVRRDVEALHARAFPGRAGVVTEEMLADLPEPVRRYLRYAGVIGRPFPGTIPLRQKGQLRPGPWPDRHRHPGLRQAGTAHRLRGQAVPDRRRQQPGNVVHPGHRLWRVRRAQASRPRHCDL
jgi:hypothetical protein